MKLCAQMNGIEYLLGVVKCSRNKKSPVLNYNQKKSK